MFFQSFSFDNVLPTFFGTKRSWIKDIEIFKLSSKGKWWRNSKIHRWLIYQILLQNNQPLNRIVLFISEGKDYFNLLIKFNFMRWYGPMSHVVCELLAIGWTSWNVRNSPVKNPTSSIFNRHNELYNKKTFI